MTQSTQLTTPSSLQIHPARRAVEGRAYQERLPDAKTDASDPSRRSREPVDRGKWSEIPNDLMGAAQIRRRTSLQGGFVRGSVLTDGAERHHKQPLHKQRRKHELAV